MSDFPLKDRYAGSVVGEHPWLYNAVEVCGVKVDGAHVVVSDSEPDGFSVYARLSDGGADCVGDFKYVHDALQYAKELSQCYGWELIDYFL